MKQPSGGERAVCGGVCRKLMGRQPHGGGPRWGGGRKSQRAGRAGGRGGGRIREPRYTNAINIIKCRIVVNLRTGETLSGPSGGHFYSGQQTILHGAQWGSIRSPPHLPRKALRAFTLYYGIATVFPAAKSDYLAPVELASLNVFFIWGGGPQQDKNCRLRRLHPIFYQKSHH